MNRLMSSGDEGESRIARNRPNSLSQSDDKKEVSINLGTLLSRNNKVGKENKTAHDAYDEQSDNDGIKLWIFLFVHDNFAVAIGGYSTPGVGWFIQPAPMDKVAVNARRTKL